MAVRVKTLEYAMDTRVTALAVTTRHDFASRTLTIEETSGRFFRSVFCEITAIDQAAAATSMTSWLIGIKLGAVAFSDTTVNTTITNSGEHQGFKLESGDLSAYFNANFGGASTQTCQIGVLFTALATINITAKLIITYEFDDTSATTRTNTVRIPLESPLVVLTAVLTEIGTNQVPQLTGGLTPFLPENTVSVKDLFFEIEGNESATAATDFQLGMSLDAEAEVLDGLHEEALISSRWFKHIWRRTDMTTTAAHQFKLRSTVASRVALATVTLVVTYSYNHAATSRYLNSIIFPIDYSGPVYASISNLQRFKRTFTISEPGTISLRQSAIRLNFAQSASTTLSVKVGPQLSRNYVATLGNVACGQYTLQHRIDAGATAGSGIAINRGVNSFVADVHAATSGTATNLSGYCLLNYESSVASTGADSHAHSTMWLVRKTNVGEFELLTSGVAPVIPEPNYWIRSLGYKFSVIATPVALQPYPIFIETEVLHGEAEGDGWRSIYSDFMYSTGSELGYSECWARARDDFKRHPFEQDTTRLDLESPRAYRFVTYGVVSNKSLQCWLTHHSMTWAVSGTLSGYSGSGAGISVEVYNPDRELFNIVTTSGGGTYSCRVYDDRPGYYTVARQDSTLLGRSDNITPV